MRPCGPRCALLALALLEPGVLFVDHIQPALAADDLTVGAPFFDGGSYLHDNQFLIFIPEIDPSPAQVVRANLNTDAVPG